LIADYENDKYTLKIGEKEWFLNMMNSQYLLNL
jgi:hypothetical protein